MDVFFFGAAIGGIVGAAAMYAWMSSRLHMLQATVIAYQRVYGPKGF